MIIKCFNLMTIAGPPWDQIRLLSTWTYPYPASSNSGQRVSAIQVRDSRGAAAFDLSSRETNEQKPILLVKSVGPQRDETKTAAAEGETETRREPRWKRRGREAESC